MRGIIRAALALSIACAAAIAPATLAAAVEDGDIVVNVEIRPRPAGPDDDLARTGIDPFPLVALAIALGVTGGAVLVADNRRRRAGAERGIH